MDVGLRSVNPRNKALLGGRVIDIIIAVPSARAASPAIVLARITASEKLLLLDIHHPLARRRQRQTESRPGTLLTDCGRYRPDQPGPAARGLDRAIPRSSRVDAVTLTWRASARAYRLPSFERRDPAVGGVDSRKSERRAGQTPIQERLSVGRVHTICLHTGTPA